MLGEAATGVGALGIAFSAHALVSEPHGVWKVQASLVELGVLILFFAAYTCVCYDAAGKSNPLVGAIIIVLVGGILPAAVGVVDDQSKPTIVKNGERVVASWSMASLARVGLVVSTLLTFAFEVFWYEAETITSADMTGPVAAGVLAVLAGGLAVYGMPVNAPNAKPDVPVTAQNVTRKGPDQVYF
jgi:hypothetical protein